LPLQSLATNAMFQKDYLSAQKFYSSALELNKRVFGENSDKVAQSFTELARVPFMRRKQSREECRFQS